MTVLKGFIPVLLTLFTTVELQKQNSKLRFSLPEDERVLFTDESIFITCTAPIGAATSRISWMNPTKNIIKNPSGRVHVEQNSDAGSIDLVLTKIQRSDRGTYTCTAEVDGRPESRNFELEVLSPITFENADAVQYAAENEDFLLLCRVTGEPTPDVHWKHVNKNLQSVRYKKTDEGLLIKNITRKDGGKYLCTATQSSQRKADFAEREITLKIKFKPEWNAPVEDLYSHVGGYVNISCQAAGEPPPIYTWFRAGESLNTDHQYTVFTEPDKSVLQIHIMAEHDFDEYVCEASNDMGRQERAIFVKEGARPSAPRLTVSWARSRTAELEIRQQPPGEGELPTLGYSVQYRLEESDWENSSNVSFNKGPRYTLNNLEPSTLYLVRAAGRNAVGTGTYSEPQKLQTEKESSQADQQSVMDASNSGNSIPTIPALCSAALLTWCTLLSYYQPWMPSYL